MAKKTQEPAADRTALDLEQFILLAELFKNFSDPTRLKIIYELSKGDLYVQEIADALKMSQSAISHQLRVLRNVRLVKFVKEGKSVKYSLDDNHVEDIIRIGVDHVKHAR
jgi:DNA-binding transcriptional ArsR family regulator